MLIAATRTRAPVSWTTCTGSLPGTCEAHLDTYGTVYWLLSIPCAAVIINETPSASTSLMPRCRAASSCMSMGP